MLKSLTIVLVVVGWLLSSTEQLPLVKRIVAHNYSNAIIGAETLESAGSSLTMRERGFRELAALIAVTSVTQTSLIRIESLGCDLTPSSSIDAQLMETHHRFILSFDDGRRVTNEVVGLGNKIRQHYYDGTVFRVGSVVFWIGIALNIYENYAARKKRAPI